jgi:hypothetical protein
MSGSMRGRRNTCHEIPTRLSRHFRAGCRKTRPTLACCPIRYSAFHGWMVLRPTARVERKVNRTRQKVDAIDRSSSKTHIGQRKDLPQRYVSRTLLDRQIDCLGVSLHAAWIGNARHGDAILSPDERTADVRSADPSSRFDPNDSHYVRQCVMEFDQAIVKVVGTRQQRVALLGQDVCLEEAPMYCFSLNDR